MVLQWLKKRTGRASPPRPAAGERLYAIGDIHGRDDLLALTLAAIGRDLQQNQTGAAAKVIFLGDYVDRGPASAAVVDQLLNLEIPGAQCLFLRGNHEQALLDAALGVADERQLLGWLTYGGRETLASYGLASDLVYSSDGPAILAALQRVIPKAHIDWLARLPLWHESGDFLFVHAGIRPGVPLEDQEPHDLLWIREDFLDHRESFGTVVVHGHSISLDVDRRDNRIGIDTGAYATGVLTTLVLEEGTQRLLQTPAAG
jgi:serine/threonine protein phosphatase 1